MLNGISLAGLSEYVHEVEDDPSEARATYAVGLDWQTGTRSRVETLPMQLGSHRVQRSFTWNIDEPRQLLGTNQAPNPQEMLLSGVGSCILVSYVVGATVLGIQLDSLRLEVRGDLDLRGFLAVDDEAPVGFGGIQYDVFVSGEGSMEQFEALHQKVTRRSPNRMTVAEGVPVAGTLHVELPDRDAQASSQLS